MQTTQNQSPKISIIVPVYNVDPYLKECLATVQAQTLADIEIICVDDGSRDRSLAILHEIAAEDGRVVVLSQQNKRQGAARNAGFDRARGEFILYFDADDKLDEACCERLYEAAVRTDSDIACMSILREKPNRSYRLVYFDREQVAEGLEERFAAARIPRQFSTVNMLYRRAWLQQIGLRFAEFVQYEDVMYSSQAVGNARRLVTVPEVAYHYIKREGSTMAARQTVKQQQDRYEAMRGFVAYADRIGLKIDRSVRKLTKRNYKLGRRLTLLKITELDNILTYRLFGFLPVWRKRVK